MLLPLEIGEMVSMRQMIKYQMVNIRPKNVQSFQHLRIRMLRRITFQSRDSLRLQVVLNIKIWRRATLTLVLVIIITKENAKLNQSRNTMRMVESVAFHTPDRWLVR